jgi:MoaA/NifB/PqqE/SkfB family radical SAM enzyme
MFKAADYLYRGKNLVHNRLFPGNKKLSTLMIYATDLCDSACKHCLIWAKRPVVEIPKEKIIDIVSNSKCVSSRTTIGLEGGEFLLHSQALEIMEWFSKNHPNFDLFSNCLKPDALVEAVQKFPPRRLYISLDGTKDTYHFMRGKDGYDRVLFIIEQLHKVLPIAVMFTLSPYNNFDDLGHVAEICKKFNVDLRVGVYNNIAFFDTLDKAHETNIGEEKNEAPLKFGDLKLKRDQMDATKEFKQLETKGDLSLPKHDASKIVGGTMASMVPPIVKEFPENYDYLLLYDKWRKKELPLKCFSILDSLVVLPNLDVPICQNLDLKLGNLGSQNLDEVFNQPSTQAIHQSYSNNCNQCWLSFHRKYDVALYRNFEKFFGKKVTSKILGYNEWKAENAILDQAIQQP